MCGVVACIGSGPSRAGVLAGLKRLEYRGYDSAGFACIDTNTGAVKIEKAVGELNALVRQLDGNPIDGSVGIGHTRWATHGGISTENAHPHLDCSNRLALVHNGIIENHSALKQMLQKAGHAFSSDTDTEVVSHLLEEMLSQTSDIKQAVVKTVSQLKGAYAFICIRTDNPDEIIAVRKGSPLCIGVAKNKNYIASDPFAFAGQTDKVIYFDDEQIARVRSNSVELFDFFGKSVDYDVHTVSIDWSDEEKKGYEHFMLKEIYQQKKAIRQTIDSLKKIDAPFWQLAHAPDLEHELSQVSLIGCGTSWHAARIAQFFFEQVAQVPTNVILGSEFRDMPFFKAKNRLYVGVSQSGETADTLESIRRIYRQGEGPVLAISNVSSSTMVREADGALITSAGQEIAVASTKAFSTQLTTLYWLAHHIAYNKKLIDSAAVDMAYADIMLTAEVLENSIEQYSHTIIDTLAPFYAEFKRFIFLGRQISYPFAMEAALKLKEISYIFSQCYPAGELKHGPIALLDNQTPVVLFSALDEQVYTRLYSNAQEVKARGAHLLVFAFEGQDELIELADNAFVIPRVNPLLGPLAMTGLMQFFVYQIAKTLGCPIDKPRNLAKSVTVE